MVQRNLPPRVQTQTPPPHRCHLGLQSAPWAAFLRSCFHPVCRFLQTWWMSASPPRTKGQPVPLFSAYFLLFWKLNASNFQIFTLCSSDFKIWIRANRNRHPDWLSLSEGSSWHDSQPWTNHSAQRHGDSRAGEHSKERVTQNSSSPGTQQTQQTHHQVSKPSHSSR